MSHEESEVNVSFDDLSEGTLPRNVHVVQEFYFRSFLDQVSQFEDSLKRLGRYRWPRRPKAAERALQELDEILSAANAVLAGVPGADTIFRQRVGSVSGGDVSDSLEAGDTGRRAAVPQVPVLGDAFAFLSDFPCADRLAGALQVLQAGFAIDLAERNTEPWWTSRVRLYIDERTAVVDRYAESMRSDLNQRPGVLDPHSSRPGSELGIPADPDIPGGSGRPVPPVGPGGGPPTLPPPDGGELPLDPCASVMDLCLGLYQEMVAESLNDHLIDLIQTVRPNCLCHDFDPGQVFTAEPGPGTQFPDPLPPEVMLVYRGEDITSRIQHADAARIEFTLPPNPHTGFVYLRALTQGSRQRRQELARLCGDLFPPIPDNALIERSPGALITIVYPPIIDSVRVSGISSRDERREKDVLTVEAEACRAIEICWRARLSDRPASLPLPPCSSIVVAVQDKTGVKVATGGSSGCFFDQGSGDREFQFQATARAGDTTCGQSGVIRLRVRRVARLRLRLDPTWTTQVAEGEQGHLVVSCSCPAPAGGRSVQLAVSHALVLDVPEAVMIREGETKIIVAFAVLPHAPRTVDITATAAQHRSATLTIEIVRPRAIVLSGGGAKGSFQAGAIAYFRRERWGEVEPDIVVGTSVGAINALGIAEGSAPADGSPDGIQRMERVWLGLRQNSDMYVDSVWLARIKELFPELQDPAEYLKPEAIVPGILFGGIFGGVLGLLSGAGVTAADKIEELVDQIRQIKFLYSLSPTRALVLGNVLFDRIPASGKKLRLATVCLEDGLIYHVTETGQIVSDVGRDPLFVGNLAGTLAMRLTNGALASAGIPVIFPFRSEAVTANGSTRFMTLVDGGVREVLPSRTAAELGARFIIAVSAGPNRVLPYESLFNGETITQFRNESILDIGVRSINLSTSEVAYNEVTPDGGFCDGVDRVFIVPSFEVHGTQEIDPGLILINMAYGYMRAFEMYARFRETVNTLQLFLLVGLSDQIGTLRKQIWELEETVLMLTDEVHGPRSVPDIDPAEIASYPPAARFFDGPTLREIRRLKQEVFDLVVARATTFGAESVPKRFDDPSIVYLNPITDWWDTWERHQEPLESLLRTFDLWSTLPIRIRIVVRNELGVPEQVFETSVPPQPVLSPDLALQLA